MSEETREEETREEETREEEETRRTFDPAREKAKADAEGRPWIAVVASGYDPEAERGGLWLEFDWNAHFIAHLRKEGYKGKNDDEIVDQWFRNVCMVAALSSMPPEAAAVLATSLQWNQRLTISEVRGEDDDGRVVYR